MMKVVKKHGHLVKETLIATSIILALTFLLGLIPWSSQYMKLLPLGSGDFELYDLYFSGKDKYNTGRDENIVLIEAGNNRVEIAKQVNVVSKYNPRVIALDLFFTHRSKDDNKFLTAINGKNNIIYANRNTEEGLQANVFNNNPDRCGFANFEGDAYSVIRSFYPKLSENGMHYDAFSPCIAKIANPERYNNFTKRNNEEEVIFYTANLENYTNFSRDELLQYDLSHQLEKIIQDKIVIIGFFIKDSTQPVLNDLHFTPMNGEVNGKSFPDMYGVVIHANILSSILNGTFITAASLWVSYLFSFLIVFIFNLYIISRLQKKINSSRLIFAVVQLLAILIIFYGFLMLFQKFHYKVILEPVMISIVLSLEMLGIYEGIARWLHQKFDYKTVFDQKS